MPDALLDLATIVPIVAPACAFGLVAIAAWLGHSLRERVTLAVVGLAFSLAAIAALYGVAGMLALGATEIRTPVGVWFSSGHYAFSWELVEDRLSAPLSLLGALLVGLVAAFSRRYLHREPGFTRFYLLLALFGAGVQLVVLAGSLDLVFIGWELVGVTSALLIAFFVERPSPVRHGLRAFVTYRVCDVGLLGAAVWLHHTAGTAHLAEGSDPWSCLTLPADGTDVAIIGGLLVFATLGKAAQIPFGGWLPRAMEGPTPSSAIFYGALSVHLGPYLLLRSATALERSPFIAASVLAIGVGTALHATLVGRVQSDIKSALAYATMTQIGLIFVEIALGLRFIAVAHIAGHMCIRTLQLLRSPSLLHDHHHLEQAMGSQLPRTGGHIERWVPRSWQPWLYRHALERGYFDALLRDYVIGGLVRLMRAIDGFEERWVLKLSGSHAHLEPKREKGVAAR